MTGTKRVLIALICLFLLTGTVFAAEGTISDMKTDCTVLADGSCQVTQTVTIDITGMEQNLEFPAGVGATRVSLAGYSAKRSTVDGCVVMTLHSDTGFTGSRTFTLTYTLDDLVTEQDGIQILSLPLLAPRWKYPVLQYAFTISLPKAFTAMPSFTSGYYADSIEDYLNISVSNGKIVGTSNKALLDHESLGMTLVVGENYFSGSYARWSVGWVTAVLIWVLCFAGLVYWMLRLRGPMPKRTARSVPPDGVIPGEMPLLLAGAKPDFNMIVLHWAQLGYLSIAVSKRGHVRLQKRVEMGSERRKVEQKLFHALFLRSDVCEGESLTYKRAAQLSMKVLPVYWGRRIYAKRSGNPRILRVICALAGGLSLFSTASFLLPALSLRWMLLILAFLVGAALSFVIQLGVGAYILKRWWLFACSVLSAIAVLTLGNLAENLSAVLPSVALAVFSSIVTRYGGRLSQNGAQLLAQVSGFRRYLSSAEPARLNLQLKRDGQYFYRMLPYAEAMGFGAAFSGSFGKTKLEGCEWYREPAPLPRKAPEFYAHLSQTLDTLNLSIRK